MAVTNASCGSTGLNPIAAENCLQGTPIKTWEYFDPGTGPDWDNRSENVGGFAQEFSTNMGGQVAFKVTHHLPYTVTIFRLGWYQGNGARKIAVVTPTPVSATVVQGKTVNNYNQPACITNAERDSFGKSYEWTDCSNWQVSATWDTSKISNIPSGVFLARVAPVTATNDPLDYALIPFVLREDTRKADVIVQTSDETWQAYNTWGGTSYYEHWVWPTVNGVPDKTQPPTMSPTLQRAVRVSYDRPLRVYRGGPESRDWHFNFLNTEYPAIRWLERNGYSVKYFSGSDAAKFSFTGSNKPKLYVSLGHDEYWDANQRMNVETARNNGVSLAFLSGNTLFWRTQFDGGGNTSRPYRTLVTYKESGNNYPLNESTWSGTWRDLRWQTPSDVATRTPENALMGSMYMINNMARALPLRVPLLYKSMRQWRGTALSKDPKDVTEINSLVIAYETSEDVENAFRPAGLFNTSSTNGSLWQTRVTSDTGTVADTKGMWTNHHLTLYRRPKSTTDTFGAWVFAAGAIFWPSALDDFGMSATTSKYNVGYYNGIQGGVSDLQQFSVNLFADMGIQPNTLQSTLVVATQTSDTTPPVVTVSSPVPGQRLSYNNPVTVVGVANDTGGVVTAVDVSTDGGALWHATSIQRSTTSAGAVTWSYKWLPETLGTATLLVRAVDDSGNYSSIPQQLTVNVEGSLLPTSLAGSASVYDFSGSIELGVRFTSDLSGTITAVKTLPGAFPSGQSQQVSLWIENNSVLTLLAKATGVPQNSINGQLEVKFANPITITAGQIYVASYSSPTGLLKVDDAVFSGRAVYSAPLHVLGSSYATPVPLVNVNGVSSAFQQAGPYNYWVDVAFSPAVANTKISLSVMNGVGVSSAGWFEPTVSPAPLELGMKFKSDVDGIITGVRYYQAAPATITKFPVIANLWRRVADNADPSSPYILLDSTGLKAVDSNTGFATDDSDSALLATGTFLNQANVIGWHTLNFATPVHITANTFYWISYFTPGGFSFIPDGFNTNGGTNNLPIDAPPLHGYASAVKSGVSQIPESAQTLGHNYLVDVLFTPTAPLQNSLWADDVTPSGNLYTTASALQLGVKFRSDIPGYVKGLRFFKSKTSSATQHLGNLWSAETGANLGSLTFNAETASGWQEAFFAQPIPIQSLATYTATYTASAGETFLYDPNYFSSPQGVYKAPLRALGIKYYTYDGWLSAFEANTPFVPEFVVGTLPNLGNGVAGSVDAMPTDSLFHNYWIDLIFTTTP